MRPWHLDMQEWRNWQTRWTQNPVNLKFVWVRLPPSAPPQGVKPLSRKELGVFSFWLHTH